MISGTKQLHIIASTDPKTGGPLEVLLTSANAMQRRGHAVEVASLDSPDAPWVSNFPLKIHPLGPGTNPYAFSRRFIPWLLQNASKYDVAVLHGLWNFSSVGGWLALRRTRTPYLVFVHGMLDPWFKAAYPIKHYAKQIYWTALEGRVLRDSAGVLFTAKDERILARTSFWGHSYNELTIRLGTADAPPNQIQQIEAFRQAFPHLPDRPFLLFLSRIHPKKGCDLLIEAFSKASKIDRHLNLVMAGPDQIGWRSALERRTQELGISDRVHWTGMLSGDVKWGALRSAKALVLASHHENFGVVVAEAMACELPVLITNKVNIWREVEESGGGLVSDDTEDEFFDLIRCFSELEEPQIQNMKRQARMGFLKYFQVENTTEDLIAACENASKRAASSHV